MVLVNVGVWVRLELRLRLRLVLGFHLVSPKVRKGLCKVKKIPKIQKKLEVGGWVQVSFG